MARYRKKALEVEAEQWFPDRPVTGVRLETLEEATRRKVAHGPAPGEGYGRPVPLAYVETAHGQRAFLEPGDWVITEPDGRGHYPCKPDIFAATYERI